MTDTAPPNGFLDLHSHLLPGIDDGCVTLEQSLACVRRLIDRGFVGSVCTPHIWLSGFPENTPVNISGWVARLQARLDGDGLDYRLWPGGEVRIARDTVSWFEQHGVPTLGASRAVLIDYWGRQWPEYGDGVIEHLFEAGYQPVLAHPERMDFDDAEWTTTIDRLIAAGVWLQGNLRCLAGVEGPQPRERMQRLLTAGRYQLVATDLHGPGDLDARLAGIEAVERSAGRAAVRRLLAERPAEILSDRVM
ncbi:MAG TPA: CpsB/CapC family capsule biosynthesis tyrosine phosphatase [Planctomycetaceae bacterium]|nr:CpsB/CapC family capsule biosynthesis tyrosine phosphatase [Planctomycetaceae bacterium]